MMIDLLQRYLQINTSAPQPDYAAAISLLEKQAHIDKLQTQIIQLPSGNSALIITLQGSDNTLPTLALNHHMDVVPADGASWTKPPFGATIVDGILIGRGVQDMKGVGIIHYSILRALKKTGPLARTIHLIAVPDEEQGGFRGAGELINSDAFKKLNIGYLLDEGLPSGIPGSMYLKISERKPLQILVQGSGTMAHGSRLEHHNIAHDLISFLNLIAEEQKKQQAQLSNKPAGLITSLNITGFQAGSCHEGQPVFNVIPDHAQAWLDIRVNPTESLQAIRQLLDTLITQFPTLCYQVKATVDDIVTDASHRSKFYEEIVSSLAEDAVKAVPYYAEESADMRFYKKAGIEAVGLSPLTSQPQLHAVNESITLDDLHTGYNVMFNLVQKLCSKGPRTCQLS